jgi:hypothetical protein
MTSRKDKVHRNAKTDPRGAKDELGRLEELLNGPLINLHLIGVVEDAAAVQKGREKGGEEAAKKRAAKWHPECIEAARKLLAAGNKQHELAGILAKRFKRDPKTIRDVLEKAGIR